MRGALDAGCDGLMSKLRCAERDAGACDDDDEQGGEIQSRLRVRMTGMGMGIMLKTGSGIGVEEAV